MRARGGGGGSRGIANLRRVRLLLLAGVAAFSFGIAITAYATGVLNQYEGSSVDARFSVRGHQRPLRNMVLVKIDDNTFNELPQYRWPYPRRVDGKLLSRILADHPAAVAFDVQLSESSSTSDEVALLAALCPAILHNKLCHKTGPVVFSSTETDSHGNVRFLGSSEGTQLLKEVGAQAGNGLFPYETDGVIRRMDYSIGHLRTLAVVAAGIAMHHSVPSSGFGHGGAWIDYPGPSGTVPSVSFGDVYLGHMPRGFFHDKIVVVGATAPTLQDIHPTSVDGQMPGPEIQADAIATVLRGLPLSSAPGWLDVLVMALLAVLVPILSLAVPPLWAVALGVLIGVLYSVAAQLAFDAGLIISFVCPLVALVLSVGGSLAVQLMTEAFERLRVRDLFARFVSENVVDEVLKNADGLRLGGVQREATVMFSDVRGFTTLAETLTPAQVIDVLNHYLSEMSEAILDHGGTLVSYMGDGIFAVFGAPLQLDDHADRALSAAREMLEVRLPRFNGWLREAGLSEGVRMGIGLNSGSVMSGHVGSERRLEYAAVGDTTNTASRIEALTKGTPHQLFMSGATKDALKAPPEGLLHFGETDIRGRAAKLELWTLDAGTPAAPQLPGASEPELAAQPAAT